GELVPHRVAQVRDGESLEPRLDLGGRVLEPVELPEEAQELADAQPLGQRQVSGGEADAPGGGAAVAGQAEPGDLDPTRVRRDDAEEHEQGRGLTGAVGPEERDALTGADCQVDAVDGSDALVLLDEPASAQDVAVEGRHDASMTDS